MENRTELMLKVYGEVVTRKALGIEDTELDEINMKYVKKWSEQCEVEHQALEIIKEKQVNYRTLLCIFNTSDNYNDYNKLYPRNKLTQEEYDLLKEVLTND